MFGGDSSLNPLFILKKDTPGDTQKIQKTHINQNSKIMKLNILFIINNPKTNSTGKCILMCRLTYMSRQDRN